jgi:hypothetical protein
MNDPRPITKHDAYDRIWAMIMAVDERGRQCEERWGTGRLTTLVGVEWADRFKAQHLKFGHACFAQKHEDVRKHGEAMLRAYDKLEELAVSAGADEKPPDQWEIETVHGLIIVVRDRNRMNQAQTFGRACQVWSLDEIESVIRNHPTIVAVKDAFPGAELVETRPAKRVADNLNDSLANVPW